MQKIAIAAGKGGVGKSTVTVNLALSFRKAGAKVGIIDADLYGPSIGNMLGIYKQIEENDSRIIPAVGLENISYVSLSLFPFGQSPSLVRAPIANHIISEFLEKTNWGNLDYLLIDFPPGTGDIQLTILQKMNLSSALLVSSPQKVSLLDVKKTLDMFKQMHVPILGLVSNMSYFKDDKGCEHQIFGSDKTEAFCLENQIPFLGKIPIDPSISFACDEGKSLFQAFADSYGALSFLELQKKLEANFLKNKEPAADGFVVQWKK